MRGSVPDAGLRVWKCGSRDCWELSGRTQRRLSANGMEKIKIAFLNGFRRRFAD